MRKTTITLAGMLLAISTSAGAQGVMCLPCLPGTYSDGTMTACKPCPAGTYQPNIMAGSCITCREEEEQYQDETGQISCKTCPSYTKGPIFGGGGYFNYSTAYISCKSTTGTDDTEGIEGTACVLASSMSNGGGCYGGAPYANISSNYCSDDSNLRDLASRFCANGGKF
ncbi:MAG: hypothetical protein LBO78_02850 [Rickettsiales bacterium]|jgi:hypothetical protein|nr:hypothetical protein [Rickettsiales bacterium]